VKRKGKLVADVALLIDWLTENIDNAPKQLRTDRDSDWSTVVNDTLATLETFGGIHSNGADGLLTKMLSDLKDNTDVVVLHFESVEDLRKLVVELNVDNGTDHLGDTARLDSLGGSRHGACDESIGYDKRVVVARVNVTRVVPREEGER